MAVLPVQNGNEIIKNNLPIQGDKQMTDVHSYLQTMRDDIAGKLNRNQIKLPQINPEAQTAADKKVLEVNTETKNYQDLAYKIDNYVKPRTIDQVC